MSDEGTPDDEAPDTGVPDDQAPDTVVPTTGASRTGAADTTVPDTGAPGTTVPSTVTPDPAARGRAQEGREGGAPIAAHGLRVGVPDGWEAQITRPEPLLGPAAARVEGPIEGVEGVAPDGTVAGDEGTMNPVVHLANFAMPADRGDFGSGAVEIMRRGDLFVAIVEYDREAAATPLFADDGPPRVAIGDFDATQMQRTRSGLVGCQRFFRLGGHAFCAYIVAPAADLGDATIAALNDVLAGFSVD
ncbi:MAG: hypothetical protein S0880_08760 [Actinomycetota bacterium]|nr:hypothetical protein [Actinomycetota bacterium]